MNSIKYGLIKRIETPNGDWTHNLFIINSNAVLTVLA